MLGPNGAGKTTMLKMLATLLPMDGGEASIFGVDVRREPHMVRQLVGVTGQYASVDENLTGYENLWLFGRLQGLSSSRSKRRTAHELLERFGLEDAADKQIAQFSGGMRRRLDLAASLITPPPLIFLDEPTTGLDPRTRGQMWDTIRDLVARRLHGAADHAVPRRGRPARRPDRGDRPRLQGRRGHARRAEDLGRQLDPAAADDRPRATRADAADVVRRVLGEEPVLTPESGGLNAAAGRRQPGRRRADRAAPGRALDRLARPCRSPPSTRCSWPSPATAPRTSPPPRRRSPMHADLTLEVTRCTTTVAARPQPIATPSPRPTLRDTVDQTLAMAWRALKKMRRNPEQFFDVTIQPLLFTAMFAYIFGGAISGSVENYLPILITGILGQTALTACMATGIQLREDMDKGVFDRFKSLPIARIAPLAGPALADLVRYATAATLTIAHRHAMGYRPGGGVAGVRRGHAADGHRRLVAGLDLHLARHHGAQRPGRAGHLDDDHVPADVPVQRVRPGRDAARLAAAFVKINPVSLVITADPRPDERRRRSPRTSAGRCSAVRSWSRSSRRCRCAPTARKM